MEGEQRREHLLSDIPLLLVGVACSVKVLCELVSPGRAPKVRRKRVDNKSMEKPQNEQLAV